MAASELLNDAGVSERETEVLALLGRHLTNAEIASRLFISVRTVESHVSSLLRKLDVTDRRALAELAASLDGAEADAAVATAVPSRPSPLTSFVGRAAERTALAELLTRHRLVTAAGPGGVGKTRLALAVAADVNDRYADGAWYVDLVPVTDPDMVAAAVAAAFDFGEQAGRSPTETVLAKLATSEALVVLDNCEHLVGGVTALVERMLSACPRLTVLATSRARLMVPYESVFAVPGLSLGEGEDEGDAVALFVERAAMAGWSSPYPNDRKRIAAICEELDGVALAIELAAARLATFGLDGLEAGLANQLSLLAGGHRLDDRHRTVRSALDWSFGLLDEHDRVVLRRASVFASSFTSAAAASVAGSAPLAPDEVAGSLARLADHSLLLVMTEADGTRYRMLETIRQYCAEKVDDVGEEAEVRGRHLGWSVATAARLQASADVGREFDDLADDLRAALGWAAGLPSRRAEAHELALRLARLTFARGLASEAQRRCEEAAALAAGPGEAAADLHLGGSVAWGRLAGTDALRLYRAAADAAMRAGDRRTAAVNLAIAAELIARSPGTMSVLPPPGETAALVAEARALAGHDLYVEATELMVTAHVFDTDPLSAELAGRAVELARRLGDARLESGALDQLTSVLLANGELEAAKASVGRRLELLTVGADEVEMAWELEDTLHMTPMVYMAAGDIETARRYARDRSEVPFLREAAHLGVAWLVTTAALAGDFDDALDWIDRFRVAWTEAGRPTIGGLAFAPSAAAMVYGLRGDDDARREWLDIVTEMRRVVAALSGYRTGYIELFDGMVALHRGDLGDALIRFSTDPERLKRWYDAVWRQWYAALWAETAVLAELPDRHHRLKRARFISLGNPVATAIVDRAEAIASGDADRLPSVAAVLAAAGCRYQQARTLVLAGGEARAEGEAIMAAIGAAPMVT